MAKPTLFSSLLDARSKALATLPSLGHLNRLVKDAQGYGQDLGRLATRVAGITAAVDGPMLRVTRGGRTTTYPIDAAEYVVGGGLACQLMVPGLSPGAAFRISVLVDRKKRQAFIEVLRDGVAIDGEAASAGEIIELRNGDVIRIEDVDFRLQGLSGDGPRAWGAAKLPRWLINVPLEALVLLLAACCLVVYGVHAYGSSAPVVAAVERPAPQRTPDIVLAELQEALRSARIPASTGLSGDRSVLTVDATKAGLDEAGEARLRTIINTAQRGSPVTINDLSRPSSAIGESIVAVALSPVQFVVGRDGRRYRLGERIAGSWTITAIEPRSVTLARGQVVARVEIPQIE